MPPAAPAKPRRRENPVRRWFRHRLEFLREEYRAYKRMAQLVIGALVLLLLAILTYPRLVVLIIKLFSG